MMGDSSPVLANPMFVTPGADFHLQTGSAAIDNGSAAVSGLVVNDHDDVARAQGAGYDIGAYERETGGGSCLTATPGQWLNNPFLSQTGTFTAEWDAIPLAAGLNALTSLSSGPQTTWSGLAAIVRFWTNNTLDARNGGTYSAVTTIPYSPNQTYHVRMVVDVPNHLYSAYITSPDGVERVLASNYAFRTEQLTVTSLDNWSVQSSTGSLQACNFRIL